MLENIRLSFQGIWAHKMRSFLTMLGIIIGIAAIIAIVSTIKGTNDQIKENLVGSGNNIVNVQLCESGYPIYFTYGYSKDGLPVMTEDIMQEILDIEEVTAVAAYNMAPTYGEIAYKDTLLEGVNLVGTDMRYLDILGYHVREGRLFTEDDIKNFKKVAILDSDTEYSLFQGEDAINKTIEIKGEPYVVIGVVDQDDSFEPVINSEEDWYTYNSGDSSGKIIIPASTWPLIYQFDEPSHIIVKASSTEDMTAAGKNTEELLNNYITTEDSQINYKSEDTLEKAKALQDLSSSTNTQLIWIASISLLVGGIGVMNIMLVSVTERTREIGLKKALGARKKSILGQFLTEASVLTSLGGLLGVGAGIGLAYLISNIAGVPVAISAPAIIISVIFSMVIGIIFGLIPSVKAANLNPIDALRYE